MTDTTPCHARKMGEYNWLRCCSEIDHEGHHDFVVDDKYPPHRASIREPLPHSPFGTSAADVMQGRTFGPDGKLHATAATTLPSAKRIAEAVAHYTKNFTQCCLVSLKKIYWCSDCVYIEILLSAATRLRAAEKRAEKAEAEAFHLAAITCDTPAGDAGGHKYCVKIVELESALAEARAKYNEGRIFTEAQQLRAVVAEYSFAEATGALAEARATNTKLNRRVQEAEAALGEWREISESTKGQATGKFYPAALRFALTKAHDEAEGLRARFAEACTKAERLEAELVEARKMPECVRDLLELAEEVGDVETSEKRSEVRDYYATPPKEETK